MAVTEAQLIKANPNSKANKAYIMALYRYGKGRDATAKELEKFAGREVGELTKLVLGKTKSDPIFAAWNSGGGAGDGGAGGGTGSAPEDEIIEKAKLTPEQRAEFEKKAYHDQVRYYGIEIPELTAKFGLPEGYDASQTVYGLDMQQYGAQRAMLGQNLQSEMEKYDLDKRQAVKEWESFKKAIETGEIDPTSAAAVAFQRNLEQKTLTLQNLQKSLSAKGTLYGGVAQRQTQLAQQPFEQQQADIQRQTQSSYDMAMAQYLGNKKGAEIQYGLDQPGGAAEQSYGGGKFNQATGQWEGQEYGLTPQQAAAKGLTFFGADPYNILIQEQQRKRELENSLKTGLASQVGQQEYAFYNY